MPFKNSNGMPLKCNGKPARTCNCGGVPCNDCDPQLDKVYHIKITDGSSAVCYETDLTECSEQGSPCIWSSDCFDEFGLSVFMLWLTDHWEVDLTTAGCMCDVTASVSTTQCDPRGTSAPDGFGCTVEIS